MSRLTDLAIKYQTDKWGHHYYTDIYDKYFAPFTDKPFTFLEIGIGGYEHPDRGGASLKMWQDYFRYAQIHGLDIHDKNFFNRGRIHTHIGSQDDEVFLNELIRKIGPPELIVDDGSHISSLTIRSFEILFPLLKPGGIYAVEDTHTSYWEDMGGSVEVNDLTVSTTINYFKRLVDDIHYIHIPGFEVKPWVKDQLQSIHFYDKQIFIMKK